MAVLAHAGALRRTVVVVSILYAFRQVTPTGQFWIPEKLRPLLIKL